MSEQRRLVSYTVAALIIGFLIGFITYSYIEEIVPNEHPDYRDFNSMELRLMN